MKLSNGLLTLLLLMLGTGHLQAQKCTAQERLKAQREQDPAFAAHMDSLEQDLELRLQESSTAKIATAPLPVLPNFSPTGDPEADRKAFVRAKKELYARDPDTYRALTRNPNATNRQRK